MRTSVVLVVGAMLAGLSAPVHAQTLYGSIAFSQEEGGGYAWGIAWRFAASTYATDEAIVQCQREGGTRCNEVGWFRDACGALAVGSGNGYGAGWGATKAAAERDALRECRSSNTNCRIEVSRCSHSKKAASGKRRTETKAATVRIEPKCRDLGETVIRSGTVTRCFAEFREPRGCWWQLYPQTWYGQRHYSGEEAQGTWSGPCSGGLANGEGTVSPWSQSFHISGDVISSTDAAGTMVDGKRHGRWKFVTTYRGRFRDRNRDQTKLLDFVHGKLQR